MPQFNSVRDEKEAIDYLLEKLEGKKSISDLKVNQHYSIDESIKLLELRKEKEIITKNTSSRGEQSSRLKDKHSIRALKAL